MKIMDRLSRILGSRDQATSEPESNVLGPFEIRLIAEGKLERLTKFAASSRLHAADPKGDTPLHLAARMGNLAVCDLFIRSGADPGALNHDRQTPADVAFAEGHGLAAQLLSSLVAGSPEMRDEFLNATLFRNLAHARDLIAAWVTDYNTARPHSALRVRWADASFSTEMPIRNGAWPSSTREANPSPSPPGPANRSTMPKVEGKSGS